MILVTEATETVGSGGRPGVRKALGRPPGSFAEFARDYAALFA
jgi:hypothetical protein